MGYNRIELPQRNINRYSFPKFSFEYPDYVRIDTLTPSSKNEYWFNIVYPKQEAVLHCTYLPIDMNNLSKVIEDSYHLAYGHAVKADEIKQNLYVNEESKVSGIIYEIEGDVATPVQFFVTDSLRHFLRGSFYYSDKVNIDSVAPFTAMVKEDIQRMIESFFWKGE